MQLSAGLVPTVCETLDEFLNGWIFVEGESWYLLSDAYKESPRWSKCWTCSHLPTNQYMEIVELYSVSVLATGFNNVGLAHDWLKKAHISEEGKQDITQKLSLVSYLREVTSGTSFSDTCSSYEHETYRIREGLPNKGDTGVLQSDKSSLENEEHPKAFEVHPSSKVNQAISKGIKLFHSLFVLLPKLFEFVFMVSCNCFKVEKTVFSTTQGNYCSFWDLNFSSLYFAQEEEVSEKDFDGAAGSTSSGSDTMIELAHVHSQNITKTEDKHKKETMHMYTGLTGGKPLMGKKNHLLS